MSNKRSDSEKIIERIKNGLIGPGSDIFHLNNKEELISDYPLQRYYSGILFPDTISEYSSV